MPLDPLTQSAIISGGLGFAGAIAGGSGRESSATRAQRLSREDTQIQRRVADAKAAGVHPLYALGAGTATPSVVGGTRGSVAKDAISSIRRSYDRYQGKRQQKLVSEAMGIEGAARTRLDNARSSMLEFELENSIIARDAQNSNSQQDPFINMENVTRFHPVKGKPHHMPGEVPAWNKFRLEKDFAFWAPSQELSEVFESVAMWPLIYEKQPKKMRAWAKRVAHRNMKNWRAIKFRDWILSKMKGRKKPKNYYRPAIPKPMRMK